MTCRMSGHMVKPMTDQREQLRDSFARRSWGDAFAELSAAHREGPLDVEDLERLALAAYMVGRDDDCEDAWMGAHQEWLRRGEGERAARCAFWQALRLFFRGDLAPAMGWVARGRRILEDGRDDCVEQAWLLMLTALPVMFEGDAEAAYPSFLEAGEIAERFGDSDATMFARLGRGQSLILQGRITEGMALLDEVMVAVMADEVSPILAGIAYCQVIALCQSVFDLRRAREWTEALSRWCDPSPTSFPTAATAWSIAARSSSCRARGTTRSTRHSERASCSLAHPPWDSLGSAYYQLGEIQRLRGEFARAEDSYRKASLAGREPEPGMSLLRLAQGRIDLAARRSVACWTRRRIRSLGPRVLPAYVEIMLEADDLEAARAAADELRGSPPISTRPTCGHSPPTLPAPCCWRKGMRGRRWPSCAARTTRGESSTRRIRPRASAC